MSESPNPEPEPQADYESEPAPAPDIEPEVPAEGAPESEAPPEAGRSKPEPLAVRLARRSGERRPRTVEKVWGKQKKGARIPAMLLFLIPIIACPIAFGVQKQLEETLVKFGNTMSKGLLELFNDEVTAGGLERIDDRKKEKAAEPVDEPERAEDTQPKGRELTQEEIEAEQAKYRNRGEPGGGAPAGGPARVSETGRLVCRCNRAGQHADGKEKEWSIMECPNCGKIKSFDGNLKCNGCGQILNKSALACPECGGAPTGRISVKPN